MVTHGSLQQAAAALEGNYTMAQLKGGITKFAKEFLYNNLSLAKSEGVGSHELQYLYLNSLNKSQLATMTAIPFASEKLFKAFRKSLTTEVREVMKILIWRESLPSDVIKKELGFLVYEAKISRHSYRGYNRNEYVLKPAFQFFSSKGDESRYGSSNDPLFNLSLGNSLRKILQQYYPKPHNSDFHFVDEIEKTDYVFAGETDILTEFPRLDAYSTQGQIKTTNNGKVSAATTGKLQKKVGIKEFYPDDDEKFMKTLRSGLLAGLVCARKKGTRTMDAPEQIRSLFIDTFVRNFISPVGVLSYFKGMSYMSKDDGHNLERVFLEVFRKLPVNKWVTTKNFTEFLRYNSFYYKPVEMNFARSKLYFEKEEETGYSDHVYIEKNYIDKANYESHVTLPFQKGICFLFAAYGLLDIAYDNIHFSEDSEVASPYEGLKYLRLTKLGAYVLGVTETYELPDSFQKSVTVLSEDSLTITADENDTTAPMVLEPYAERVSPNRYRTDFSFFLKGVKSKRELESKITLFKQAVKVDLPNNWLDFFKELDSKIEPLDKVGAVKVFKIPKEDTELLKLIARDPTLQKHCMKAENYHIIIPNKSVAAFRNRLREFGYLMN